MCQGGGQQVVGNRLKEIFLDHVGFGTRHAYNWCGDLSDRLSDIGGVLGAWDGAYLPQHS